MSDAFAEQMERTYHALGGAGRLAFPFTTREALRVLKVMHFAADRHTLRETWGRVPSEWSMESFFKLGLLLSRARRFKHFPCAWDNEKDPAVLAHEVARYLRNVAPEYQNNLIAAQPATWWRKLLSAAGQQDAPILQRALQQRSELVASNLTAEKP